MTADSLALRLVDWPAGRWVLLRKLLNGLQTHKPFEVRFTMQHVLIIHPSDDWVASNTPISVVLRVAGSDALAASVSVRELGLAQAEDRLHQLGAVPQGLSEFLHELVTQALPAAHPDTAPVP